MRSFTSGSSAVEAGSGSTPADSGICRFLARLTRRMYARKRYAAKSRTAGRSGCLRATARDTTAADSSRSEMASAGSPSSLSPRRRARSAMLRATASTSGAIRRPRRSTGLMLKRCSSFGSHAMCSHHCPAQSAYWHRTAFSIQCRDSANASILASQPAGAAPHSAGKHSQGQVDGSDACRQLLRLVLRVGLAR
jgi:hypothetical protein